MVGIAEGFSVSKLGEAFGGLVKEFGADDLKDVLNIGLQYDLAKRNGQSGAATAQYNTDQQRQPVNTDGAPVPESNFVKDNALAIGGMILLAGIVTAVAVKMAD